MINAIKDNLQLLTFSLNCDKIIGLYLVVGKF